MPSALEILISDYLSANNHLSSDGYSNPDAEKLIEAAKAEHGELLKACEFAGDALYKDTWELRSRTPKAVNEAIDVIRAAIAKAKPHHFSPVGHATPSDRDKCRLCGHDIRNDIHLRAGESAKGGD